jgi:hypothetical protein
MINPLALNPMMHGLPGLDMQAQGQQAPKPIGIGTHGPWHINPGNPNFPNHRPYLSNNKPPVEVGAAPSQKVKPV